VRGFDRVRLRKTFCKKHATVAKALRMTGMKHARILASSFLAAFLGACTVAQQSTTADAGVVAPLGDAAVQVQPDADVRRDAAVVGDATVANDGGSPADTGTPEPATPFTPSALFTVGVPVTYACTSSPISWPVEDTTNPQPAPLPPTFSLSATVKIIANPAQLINTNLSPLILAHTFTPVTPESASNDVQVSATFRFTNGSLGFDQSSSSDATKIQYRIVVPSPRYSIGSSIFTQTSPSHFRVELHGVWAYQALVPMTTRGHVDRAVDCVATF
jgi:hypothetical protein